MISTAGRVGFAAYFVGTFLLASIGRPSLLFVSGHGHLISPRSRNFFAYEAGRDDTTNSPPGLPPREYCSHCLNAKLAAATCGRGSAQSYDPIDGWKDTYGNPMPWTSQATYVEGQEVLMSIELTTNHAGHAEIMACPLPDEGDASMATQECFDAHPLTFVRDVCYNGPVDTLYPVRGYFSNNVMHHFIYKLPPGLTAPKVLLQWRYIAANSCIPPGYKDEERLGLNERGWLRGFSMEDCNVNGDEPPQLVLDPTGARGAGDPEQFWNCAEVTVVPESTANPDPGPHPAGVDICEISNPPPTSPTFPWTPAPQVISPEDPNEEGYCNWGPLGTAMSSTCDGCVQGGDACNGGAHQCESDCGGKWCTNVEDISPTCENNNAPPPSPSNSFYCGTSWMDAKESSCKPLSEGGGLTDTATPCSNGNSTVCAPSGYCYADIFCSYAPTPIPTNPPQAPIQPTNPPQAPLAPPPLVASTTRYWDCSGGACGCAYLPGGSGTDSNSAHCHSNALFSAPPGNEYGATYYGAAAISRFLWDGNTNSGDWLGEGCGKCWKVTGSSNTGLNQGTATTTTVVLKGTNICPTGICNENGKAHFDIAAPGFDVLEYSWSNTCKDLEPDNIEGLESCGRWMIDSQDPETNCDCSKFISPVLKAGCENFYAMQWDNPSVVYKEVSCPEEIANLPCWEQNGNGYPQDGIPETCMDPNGDPNTMLPFPGSSPVTPPSPTPPQAPITPPNPPQAPTPLDAIECPVGFETARWTWYISYPKCCADQDHYDPLAPTDECEIYNGCAWDGDFAYVGNRPFDYVQKTDIVAFFASNGETHPKKIIRVYSPSHEKTVDAIVLDTCGDDDCNGCCTENADIGGGYLVDMEENTVVRHFGALNEASGLVCWQILPDEDYDAGGYCNWGECSNEGQGGWACNLNEYECETTCGGSWCTSTPPTPQETQAPVSNAPITDPITSAPVIPPTTAPVDDPTSSPVIPPTTAPVVDPTSSPVIPPTTAPVKDPTSSPVIPPTTAPVGDPTSSPVIPPTEAPQSGGDPCCTWDMKDCSKQRWCNKSESNCLNGCGGPFWSDVSACPADGIAKGKDCTNNPNCCPGLYCKVNSQWYHSCEIPRALPQGK